MKKQENIIFLYLFFSILNKLILAFPKIQISILETRKLSIISPSFGK